MSNDTETLTLTEFLLARLDEDYEVAWGAAPSPWREGKWDGTFDGPREVVGRHGDVTAVCYYGGTYGHVLRFDPTRVIKDIEAKRRIVEGRSGIPHPREDCDGSCDGPNDHWHMVDEWETLATLAAVYADHPDYRDEWKP